MAAFLPLLGLSLCLTQAGASHHHRSHHHLHARADSIAEFTGYQLASSPSFSDSGLPEDCEKALYAEIYCDDYVQELSEPVYHGSLGDESFTNSVCASSCGDSLRNFHDNVVAKCGTSAEALPGVPALSVVDAVWSGWNETCLRASNGSFCNDILVTYPPVNELSDMPAAQLCSECWVSKLKLMQSSPYSAYDNVYQSQLDYTLASCDLSMSSTEPTEGGVQVPASNSSTCSTEKEYTVQDGDTCDSIALANSVSSGTLYAENSALFNCSEPKVGLKLCLPAACENVYQVQPTDDCVSVAVSNGISWRELISYNGMLYDDCSNFVGADPSFGTVMCVSPPGGKFDLGVSDSNSTASGVDGQGGSGTGYGTTQDYLAPGATLAPNTTTECGNFYTVVSGDTCRLLLAESNTPFDLFVAANPSITSAKSCDSELEVGLTYCLHPLRNFNDTASTTTTAPSTVTATSTSTSASVPTSTKTDQVLGIVAPLPDIVGVAMISVPLATATRRPAIVMQAIRFHSMDCVDPCPRTTPPAQGVHSGLAAPVADTAVALLSIAQPANASRRSGNAI
ncbi:LysM peptidoglycan-binding domain-containing protein [Aspergillus mulundensis]|uniref:LysM domain-containing protein n=1 Tax=Aspergillus mulundensis TaxID=1810919 RepID=A0A3D8REH8_9EURO|nr:hypothetical protein DSM5745_07518 [Aspergillus mulundensis]RDW72346.1 hypothetical protein DSM5745_07518 [Aspergillus mulundensis]